jgi:hypothetical protein
VVFPLLTLYFVCFPRPTHYASFDYTIWWRLKIVKLFITTFLLLLSLAWVYIFSLGSLGREKKLNLSSSLRVRYQAPHMRKARGAVQTAGHGILL